MADVFISYHMKSAGELAQQIADALETVGISCWYANRDMIPGQFVKSIMDAINQCKIFLLILNEEANQSKYVFNELSNAYRRFEDGIIILPFKVGDFQVSDNVQFFLTTLHTINGGDSMKTVRTEELTQKVAESLGTSWTPTPNPPQKAKKILAGKPEPPKRKKISLKFRIVTCILIVTAYVLCLGCFYHPTWKVEKEGNLDGEVTLTISGAGEMDYGNGLTRFLLNGRFLDASYPPWYAYSAIVTKAEIHPGVRNIKAYAFYNFSRLETVTIYKGVTSIDYNAFHDCTRLRNVVIPDNVTKIGAGAFWGCKSLTSVGIPDGVTIIGNSAFLGCASLTSIGIPDSVTTIGNSAFSGCTSLTSVEIPAKVTTIGSGAFLGCTSLTSVEIPASVRTIGVSAFSDCTSLTSVGIPDSVTTIQSYAFANCTNLNHVFIPDSVTTIEKYAFIGCERLETVSLPSRFLMGLPNVFPDRVELDCRMKLN